MPGERGPSLRPAAPLPRSLLLQRRREFIVVTSVAIVIVFVRCFVFLFYEQADFDSDQAVMGLMAKHISELRAFPLFQYALDYVLVVEAYLAAPFVWVAGATVTSLKTPLFLMNCLTEALLIGLFVQTLALRPLLAGVATIPFLIPPAVTSAGLVEALGGNIEVFVYVLLLWLTRRRPVVFGLVFGLGFLNREFTAYGLSSLLLIEAFDRSLFTRANVTAKLVSGLCAVAVWDLVRAAKPLADAFGPGSTLTTAGGDAGNLAVMAGFFCWDAGPDRWMANLGALVTFALPLLYGALPFELARGGVNSVSAQGASGSWVLIGGVLVFVALRTVFLRRRPLPGPEDVDPRFCWYLILVAAQAAVVYALSRCGDLAVAHLRYFLLALLAPVGLLALFFASERSRGLKSAIVAFVCGWGVLTGWSNGALVVEYARTPPLNSERLMADYLLKHDIRFGRAGYWDSYVIDFLTREQVVIAPHGFLRIEEYENKVRAHEQEAVFISREPCPGSVQVARLFVCRP
jgi:hypothetical protein